MSKGQLLIETGKASRVLQLAVWRKRGRIRRALSLIDRRHKETRMTKPLIVEIPHQLGREEARRRLETGIGQLKTKFGDKLSSVDESWTGDHLDVVIKAMGQGISAGLDVETDHVRLEVQLPWMLAMLAEKAKGFIRKEGQLLLEKK
jgi:hypothetical protein